MRRFSVSGLLLAGILTCSAIPSFACSGGATAAQPAAVRTAEEDNPELTAVGGLGASNLYTTYLAVGAIHDHYLAGTYDSATTVTLAQTIHGLLETSIEQLRDVQSSPSVSAGDAVFLAEMVDAYVALRNQAARLVVYVQSGTETDSAAFQQEREQAWQKISGLLGLE